MRKIIASLSLITTVCAAWILAFSPSVAFALNVSAYAINANAVWNQGITGSGICVAVVDSGISTPDHPDTMHPALANVVVHSEDFTDEGTVNDLYGHGTHVAGIIAGTGNPYKGVAFGCQLVNVKVIDEEGDWYPWTYEDGLDWIIDNRETYGIDIVNLCLGEMGTCDGTCELCLKAEEAIDAGIVVVAAAGNWGLLGDQRIDCPGNSFNVITVGACDDHSTIGIADDTLSLYSSRGPTQDGRPKPDLLAPGGQYWNSKADRAGIWSCAIPLDENYEAIALNETGGPYAVWGRASGTSMATPHVSGTVALMLQANPNLTPAQVKAILRQTARLNNNLNGLSINQRGYGIVDATQAVYVSQHIILLNGSLTYDSFQVQTPTDGNQRSMQFDVTRSSFGINMSSMRTCCYPYDPLFRSLTTPYVWIDGSIKNLGPLEKFILFTGPRVSSKGAGSATVKTLYKIDDVTVRLNYYVATSKIQFWVLISSGTSHSYSKLMYIDPDLWDPAHDYATYTNSTTIQLEKKLTNTEIYVKDVQEPVPYLDCAPYLGSPYLWILKHDGQVYSNPENGRNGESIYNTNIVLYYQYPSTFMGPVILIKYS